MAKSSSSSLTDRTLSGLIWQFAGTGSEAVSRVLVMIALARLLSPEEFGVAAAAQIFIAFSQVLSQLGMGPAVVQRSQLDDRHIGSAFAFSLYSGLAAGLAIALGAPLAADFFDMPGLTPVIQVLALSLPIANAAIVSEGLLLRELRFKRLALSETLSFMIGYGAVGIALAYLGFGTWSLVLALLTQTTLRTVLLMRQARHRLTGIVRWAPLKDLLHFSIGQSLSHLGNYFALQADNMVVGHSLGAAALGLYGRAYQFLTLPSTLFGKVVDRVLFPAMSSVQNEPDRLMTAFHRAIGTIAMITIPVSGMLVLLAPELIVLLLGGQWANVVAPFRFLAAFLVFRTSYKISDSLARARGRVYSRAWRQWLYALAVLVGAYLGVGWGLAGVAAGVGCAILLNFLMMMQLSLDAIGGRWAPVIAIHVRHLLCGALIVAPAWLAVFLARLTEWPGLAVIAIGSAVSGVAALVMLLGVPSIFGGEGRWATGLVMGKLRRKKAGAPG